MPQTLLVIDVQKDVVNGAFRRDQVVSNIAALVNHFRAHGAPVMWVQHHDRWMVKGSSEWQIVDELQPRADEPRIDKQYRSSFEQTTLADHLQGVDEIVVCGAETNYCIRHTIHSALDRGFSIVLVSDAHTCGADNAASVIEEQNDNFADYRLPGRTCRTATTEQVLLTSHAGLTSA